MSTANLNYRATSLLIDRAVMSGLTPSQYQVIRFIFDRTVGDGTEWARIPEKHWTTEGFDRDERTYYRGSVRMCRTTRKKCLDALAGFTLIRIEKTRKGTRYALAEYLIDIDS